MDLTNDLLNHTLKTNSPGLVSDKKKNCVLKEMLSTFKNISAISHLILKSRAESHIKWCSESIKRWMENTRKEWSVYRRHKITLYSVYQVQVQRNN